MMRQEVFFILACFALIILSCKNGSTNKLPNEESTNKVVLADQTTKATFNYFSLIKTINISSDSCISIRVSLEKLKNNSDTINLIKELLLLEGDERKSDAVIINKRPNHSDIYMGQCKWVSVQVAGLCIINDFIFLDSFYFQNFPVLVDDEGNEGCVAGPIVAKAFRCYNDVFKNKSTIKQAWVKENKYMPLQSCGVKWFGSQIK